MAKVMTKPRIYPININIIIVIIIHIVLFNNSPIMHFIRTSSSTHAHTGRNRNPRRRHGRTSRHRCRRRRCKHRRTAHRRDRFGASASRPPSTRCRLVSKNANRRDAARTYRQRPVQHRHHRPARRLCRHRRPRPVSESSDMHLPARQSIFGSSTNILMHHLSKYSVFRSYS